MKRIFLLSIAAYLCASGFTSADEYGEFGDYWYTYKGNGTCTIIYYLGTGGDITIPDTLNGLTVTSIGGAFAFCDSLTSVVIPYSVTSIGGAAFSNCTSLTDIVIPDSVTSIGDRAFSFCTGLTGVIIPDSVTSIGERCVPLLHQPDQRCYWQQRHQHRRQRVRFLHQPDRHNGGYKQSRLCQCGRGLIQ